METHSITHRLIGSSAPETKIGPMPAIKTPLRKTPIVKFWFKDSFQFQIGHLSGHFWVNTERPVRLKYPKDRYKRTFGQNYSKYEYKPFIWWHFSSRPILKWKEKIFLGNIGRLMYYLEYFPGS